MSKPQDKKQSTTKQWIRRILSRKRQASPVSQHPDALDVRNTTTAIDIFSSSTSVSRPQALPVSPQSVIVNQPSTVPGPTGIGEHIGHASCTDRHQPGSQIITLRFSLATRHQAILRRIQCKEEACTGFWHNIQ